MSLKSKETNSCKLNFVTEVMFRKEKDGSILAVFPYEVATQDGHLMSYARMGQHGHCDYGYVLSKTKPATPGEYKDLLKELKGLGYSLKIVKKRYCDRILSTL